MPGRLRIVAANSLDDMAEKQAAKQRKKIAYDKKELDDLTKQMPDPNEDLLIGTFSSHLVKGLSHVEITALLRRMCVYLLWTCYLYPEISQV